LSLDHPLATQYCDKRWNYCAHFCHQKLPQPPWEKKTFTILVALDEKETAMGELYWDDGDSIDPIETQYLFSRMPSELEMLANIYFNDLWKFTFECIKLLLSFQNTLLTERFITSTKEILYLKCDYTRIEEASDQCLP